MFSNWHRNNFVRFLFERSLRLKYAKKHLVDVYCIYERIYLKPCRYLRILMSFGPLNHWSFSFWILNFVGKIWHYFDQTSEFIFVAFLVYQIFIEFITDLPLVSWNVVRLKSFEALRKNILLGGLQIYRWHRLC